MDAIDRQRRAVLKDQAMAMRAASLSTQEDFTQYLRSIDGKL